MEIKIQGKTISQLTEKAEIENDDAFILQDGQETKHAKASALKSYVQQDLSGYATKDEVNGKVSTETYNADKATFATKTELNEKVSTDTYNADKATFATKTELGTKLDTSTYNSDKESFATKTELGTKVSGTGVTKMQVVTELPESPDASTLYILTASDETE